MVDGKAPLDLIITAGDVQAALRKEHSSCAVAESAVRCFDLTGAVVSTRTAYLIRGTTAFRYEVPERIAREIVSFDRGGPFMPGSYKLLPPRKREERGNGTGHGPRNRAAGKLRHRVTEGLRARLHSVGR